jgi:hypothetical protein
MLLALALVLAFLVPTPRYDKFIAGIETRRLLTNGNCPLSSGEVRRNTAPEVLELCVKYGLRAYLDAKSHLPSAERVYGVLGATTELHKARQRYGPKVIAVIDRYYTRGSTVAQASHTTGEVVRDIWKQIRSDPLAFQMPERPRELAPEDFAAYALHAIRIDGEIFLAQFAWQDDGTVTRKLVESVAQNTYSAFMGGVRDFERKVITDQELTAYDYGEAVLDGAVLFAGWKLLAKPAAANVAVGATAGARSTTMTKLTAATAKAGKAFAVSTKVGAVGTVGTVSYLLFTDPLFLATGVASAGGWVTKTAGLPGWFGEGIGWFLLLGVLWGLSVPVRRVIGILPWRLVLRRRR